MSSTLPSAILSEIQADMVALRNRIQSEENSIAQLRNAHPTLPDAVFQLEAQIARTRSSVVASKQMYQRLSQAHQSIVLAARAGTLSAVSQQTEASADLPVSAAASSPEDLSEHYEDLERHPGTGERTLHHSITAHPAFCALSMEELRLRDLQSQLSSSPSHTHVLGTGFAVSPSAVPGPFSHSVAGPSPWVGTTPHLSAISAVCPWKPTSGASGFAALVAPEVVRNRFGVPGAHSWSSRPSVLSTM